MELCETSAPFTEPLACTVTMYVPAGVGVVAGMFVLLAVAE